MCVFFREENETVCARGNFCKVAREKRSSYIRKKSQAVRSRLSSEPIYVSKLCVICPSTTRTTGWYILSGVLLAIRQYAAWASTLITQYIPDGRSPQKQCKRMRNIVQDTRYIPYVCEEDNKYHIARDSSFNSLLCLRRIDPGGRVLIRIALTISYWPLPIKPLILAIVYELKLSRKMIPKTTPIIWNWVASKFFRGLSMIWNVCLKQFWRRLPTN